MSIVTIPPFLRHKIQFCEKPTKTMYTQINQNCKLLWKNTTEKISPNIIHTFDNFRSKIERL